MGHVGDEGVARMDQTREAAIEAWPGPNPEDWTEVKSIECLLRRSTK